MPGGICPGPCHACSCVDPVCRQCGRAPCSECGEALEDCAGHPCQRCGTITDDRMLCDSCQEIVAPVLAVTLVDPWAEVSA